MNKERAIKNTEGFVKQNLEGYDSGHDWWHIERVRGLAGYINTKEVLADPFTLEIAALLHDSADSKFAGDNIEQGYTLIYEFMDKNELSEIKDQVIEVIRNVSFSKKSASGNLSDPVLLIVQDADRLDAIGAIGIARAFNYGGFRNNPIYIPEENNVGNSRSTIGHFYDKLLKLKGLMNTKAAKNIAEERHIFLEIFLEKFMYECGFAERINY